MTINPNCWSEHGELKTVVVTAPSVWDVSDQQTATDVQWEKPVDRKKAYKNHEKMVRAMERAGTKVIDYAADLPKESRDLNEKLLNRYFVRDLACVFGKTVLPGVAGTSMRKPEYVQAHQVMKNWFEEEVFLYEGSEQKHPIEFGDVLILNRDAVFINVGLRTSIESVEHSKQAIFDAGFSEIGIIDLPRRADTLHLDMNCNMVGQDMLLAKSYMRYFPVQVVTREGKQYMMPHDFLARHNIEAMYTSSVRNTVSDINFLNLDPETLLVSSQANQKIFSKELNLKKKQVIKVDVEELEKGGGGIRCMTLPLVRS